MTRPIVFFDEQIFTIQRYGGISRYFFEMLRVLPGLAPDCDFRVVALLYINEYLDLLPSSLVFGKKLPSFRFDRHLMRQVRPIGTNYLARCRNKKSLVHETYYADYEALRSGHSVITVYDMAHEIFPEFYPRDETVKNKRRAINRADHIVCISQATASALSHFYPATRTKQSVIYPGVDIARMGSSINVKKEPIILYVGERTRYKNFWNLVRACAADDWLLRNFRLVCFGGGKFTSTELILMHHFGLPDGFAVQKPGNDEELASYYAQAALFVYPSTCEGFGIPIIEAMAARCPVCCSDIASFKEIAAGCANFFPPESVEALSATIRMLVETSPSSKMLDIGERIAKTFTWEACAQKHVEIYRRVMDL